MSSKKSIRWLTAAVLITTLQSQALTTTIVVNTTADENGTTVNSTACALREALVAAKNKAAFGGCTAGAVSGSNLIQLDAGTYNLSLGELVVATSVTIAGKDTVRPDEVNLYTGQKPNRLRPDKVAAATAAIPATDTAPAIAATPASGTIIHATPGSQAPALAASRIFNTSADIVLRDLVLQGNYPAITGPTTIDSTLTASEFATAAVPGNGGIIDAGASVTMDNVIVSNAYVAGSTAYKGGAIYLNRHEANLSLTDVTFRHNRANGSGGVVAMVCEENGRLAAHDISSNRALFEANRADAGAGFIEVCGDSSLTMSTSTLSANRSVASGVLPTGAIAYNQSSIGVGTLALSFITAAEHGTGPVLSVGGLSSITLTHSVFVGNTQNCQLPPTSDTQPAGVKFQGSYIAITSGDHSCDSLLNLVGGNNQEITSAFSAVLLPLANHGGLVNGYLPLDPSPFVLNKGDVFDNCSSVDQRGFVRKSGTKCDIGALERLEPTANDDTASSKLGTDRLVIVDVLANDVFGESDGGPNKYAEPAVVVGSGDDNPQSQCLWIDATNVSTLYPNNPEYKNHLIVQSYPKDPDGTGPLVAPPSGTPTSAENPIECKYRLSFIPNGGTVSQLSPSDKPAVVKSTVKNAPPKAVADVYVRPLGVGSISINPILNDNDDGDGIYGTPAQWGDFPVYISKADMPTLGKIEGTQGRCADYTSTNAKLCYAVPFTYVSNNSIAPFTDSFKYSVQDKEGASSSDSTVSIKTDALNPDEGQTGGSLDILGGLILALLGLRRTRKL